MLIIYPDCCGKRTLQGLWGGILEEMTPAFALQYFKINHTVVSIKNHSKRRMEL